MLSSLIFIYLTKMPWWMTCWQCTGSTGSGGALAFTCILHCWHYGCWVQLRLQIFISFFFKSYEVLGCDMTSYIFEWVILDKWGNSYPHFAWDGWCNICCISIMYKHLVYPHLVGWLTYVWVIRHKEVILT